MQFRLLGSVEAWHDGRRVPLGPRKQRFVLAVLALEANRLVPVDRLVELAWPDSPPRSARHAIQVCVSRLRAVLAQAAQEAQAAQAAVLATEGSGYVLRTDPMRVDAHRFRSLVAQARDAGTDEQAAAVFREALGLWRGPPLAGTAPEEVRARLCRGLDEARLVAVEDWIDAELRLGHHRALLDQLAELSASNPLRERLIGQFMLALHRSGRTADALEVSRHTRSRLVDELGLDPGPQLQRLESAILRRDPTLDPTGQEPALARRRPTPPASPAQLPADVASFVGRGEDLHWLDLMLATREWRPSNAAAVPVISGTAGVGKTALAVHWAHQVRDRFPDGQLYVNLRGHATSPALRPAQALARFLRALRVPPEEIPAEEDEQAAMYRSLLASRRMLVVLDDALDAAQAQPLLPGGPGCMVLVTSRAPLADLEEASPLVLDVLPVDDAVSLLARFADAGRVEQEPAAANRIVRQCGLLPLAVRIAGARLRARPAWPLARMAARLDDEHRRLDELAIGDLAVRSSFLLTYRALAPEDARTFRQLGLLDGPDVTAGVVAALTGRDAAATEASLERLADAQLLETTTPGRYRFHDLVRLFAREQVEEGADEAAGQAALARALRWYLAGAECADELLKPTGLRSPGGPHREAIAFADREEALGWLEAERPNLVAAAQQAAAHAPAPPAEVAWQLSNALWRFFDLRKHWADWHATCQAALQAAQRVGNRDAAGRALNNLGVIHGQQRRYQEAIACLEQSLTLCRQARDRHSEGRVLNNLGSVYREQRRHQEAIACFEQSLRIRRELGDRHGESIAVNNLGSVYQEQQRYGEAIGCYERDLALCRQVGDRRGEGQTLNSIGDVHRAQGSQRDAIGSYEQALAISREVGDRYEEAQALRGLGHVAAAVQGAQAAHAHWTMALGILEGLGAPQAEEVRALLEEHDHPS